MNTLRVSMSLFQVLSQKAGVTVTFGVIGGNPAFLLFGRRGLLAFGFWCNGRQITAFAG